MSTTVPQSLSFRSYQQGDENHIIEMFNDVFGRRPPLAEWQWKFQHNPYAPPQAYTAWQPNGELVAHYTMMPIMLNVMGKPMLAAQSLDTMVSPSQRGKRLFEKTASACYEQFVDAGGGLVFGFPNEQSYPGFMRKLQWKRISYLKEYSLRIGIKQLADRVSQAPALNFLSDLAYRTTGRFSNKIKRTLLHKRIPPHTQFQTSDSVPNGTNALWQAIRSYNVFSVWKDETYLSWRYDRSTRHSFQYAYLTVDGDITALAVLARAPGETMYITELLVRDHSILQARYLLAQIAKVARNQGYDKLTFIGVDHGFFDSVFEQWQSHISTGLVLCARPFALEQLRDMVVLPHNWSATLGDTDVL